MILPVLYFSITLIFFTICVVIGLVISSRFTLTNTILYAPGLGFMYLLLITAMHLTSGYSSYLFISIVSIFMLHGVGFSKSWQAIKIEKSWIIESVLILILCYISSLIFYYDFNTNEVKVYVDECFSSWLSEYIKTSGIESYVIDQSYSDTTRRPFHYSELYAIQIVKIFIQSATNYNVLALCIVPLCLSIIITTFCHALKSHINNYMGVLGVFCFFGFFCCKLCIVRKILQQIICYR